MQKIKIRIARKNRRPVIVTVNPVILRPATPCYRRPHSSDGRAVSAWLGA